jgi:outer membrane lipoprotein LolB
MSSVWRHGLLLAMICAALAACRTLPPATTTADLGLSADWPQRRALLQALRQYECVGRVAVAAAGEGFNAQFTWRQSGAAAQLTLRGPLGAGGLVVRASGSQIAVQMADGRMLDGDAARVEMERAIGAPLPITDLGYWLLGLAQPDGAASETLAPAVAGQPAQLGSLEQQGWRVEYQAHSGVPRQMTLTRGLARVRLVIERWDWR